MRWVGRFLRFLILAAAALALFAFFVMRLWNWLMPAIFGLHTIYYAQSLGLLVLCRILFGRFGGRFAMRHRLRERWSQMTPEQRAKFCESLRSVGEQPSKPIA